MHIWDDGRTTRGVIKRTFSRTGRMEHWNRIVVDRGRAQIDFCARWGGGDNDEGLRRRELPNRRREGDEV